MPNRRMSALDYLRLIADGYTIIESSGSWNGQMTIQAPSDWEFQEGDELEYIIDFRHLQETERR